MLLPRCDRGCDAEIELGAQWSQCTSDKTQFEYSLSVVETTGFRCPESSRRGVETRNAGSLKRWENLVDPGQSKNKVMQRHENFLSNTEKVTASFSTTLFLTVQFVQVVFGVAPCLLELKGRGSRLSADEKYVAVKMRSGTLFRCSNKTPLA